MQDRKIHSHRFINGVCIVCEAKEHPDQEPDTLVKILDCVRCINYGVWSIWLWLVVLIFILVLK